MAKNNNDVDFFFSSVVVFVTICIHAYRKDRTRWATCLALWVTNLKTFSLAIIGKCRIKCLADHFNAIFVKIKTKNRWP